jgi:AraC-like DNA-binding protein
LAVNHPALTPDFHDHRAGTHVALHTHQDGQVLIATEGSMQVWFGTSRMQLAPHMAVWVPPGMPHAARSLEDTAFRGIMIDLPRASRLPASASYFVAAPIFVAATLDLVHARESQRRLASQLLADELSSRLLAQVGPLLPTDLRFVEICAKVLDDVASAPSLAEATNLAGMSRRSFTRAFRAATGISWMAWVREARLAQAASLLARGARVTDAALAVGYATPSAFSVAFRRDRGTTPVDQRIEMPIRKIVSINVATDDRALAPFGRADPSALS